MFDVAVEQELAAAHWLRGYHGKCENLHGHNWKVRVEVTAGDLDGTGLALDFSVLKNELAKILAKFDHTLLNDLPEFQEANPTSENLAKVIYRQCQAALQVFPVRMKAVWVWESSRAFVRYYE